MTFEEFYDKRNQGINEASLSRVYKHYTEHDSGTISGFRYATKCGEGETYSSEANNSRNRLLKSKLLTKGFGVIPIKGVYIENYGSDKAKEIDEESFFVVDLEDKGILKETLIQLGGEFDQDSVTFSEKGGKYSIIGTSKYCEDAYPKLGVEILLGTPAFGSDGVFHSKVKGRPFVFKTATKDELETLDKHTSTEIRSITHLSESSVGDLNEETTSGDIAQAPSRIGAKGDIIKRVFPLEVEEEEVAKEIKPKSRGYYSHW